MRIPVCAPSHSILALEDRIEREENQDIDRDVSAQQDSKLSSSLRMVQL